MKEKHIQNSRNENMKENYTKKQQDKNHIQENKYIKNEKNLHEHTHTHVGADGKVYTHTHTHSPEIVKNELNRIARIIGHMKSIKIMIESGRDCSEVLIQLAAVDAAIKSLSRVILKEHMETCIVDAIKTGDELAIEALNEAIDKFMK